MPSPFCFFKYQWREYSDFKLCKYFINSGKPKSEINKPRSHLHYKELLYRRNWLQHRSPRHNYYSSAQGHSAGPLGVFATPRADIRRGRCYMQLLHFSGSEKLISFSPWWLVKCQMTSVAKVNQISRVHTHTSQRVNSKRRFVLWEWLTWQQSL